MLTVLRGDSDAAVKEVESLQAKMEDEKVSWYPLV